MNHYSRDNLLTSDNGQRKTDSGQRTQDSALRLSWPQHTVLRPLSVLRSLLPKFPNPISLISIISLILLTLSCKQPQKGTLSVQAQTDLEVLAARQWETEDKFHKLAEIIAGVMEEALAKPDDAAMINHIKEFNSINEDALRQLGAEIDFWFKYVDKEEKNEFLMRFWPKDYAKKLRASEARFYSKTKNKPEYRKHFQQLTRAIEMRK